LVFCSGRAGIDPATGAIADGIEAQTEQALLNLTAVLSAAESSMEDVVASGTRRLRAEVDRRHLTGRVVAGSSWEQKQGDPSAALRLALSSVSTAAAGGVFCKAVAKGQLPVLA
jgi:hypothetical protein